MAKPDSTSNPLIIHNTAAARPGMAATTTHEPMSLEEVAERLLRARNKTKQYKALQPLYVAIYNQIIVPGETGKLTFDFYKTSIGILLRVTLEPDMATPTTAERLPDNIAGISIVYRKAGTLTRSDKTNRPTLLDIVVDTRPMSDFVRMANTHSGNTTPH